MRGFALLYVLLLVCMLRGLVFWLRLLVCCFVCVFNPHWFVFLGRIVLLFVCGFICCTIGVLCNSKFLDMILFFVIYY